MVRIILDQQGVSALAGIDQAELCDGNSRSLGYFFSETGYKRLVIDLANSLVTVEELECRLQEGGGRPLADILADLERQ